MGCDGPESQGDLIVATARSLLAEVDLAWFDAGRADRERWASGTPDVQGADLALIGSALSLRSLQSFPAASDQPTVIAAPAVGRGRVWGALWCRKPAGRGFSASEQHIVRSLVAQAALGIEAAHSVAVERERSAEMDWISGVSEIAARAIRAQPSIDRTLATATRLVPMLAGADRCALLTAASEGRFKLHSSYGLDDEQIQGVAIACESVLAETLGTPLLAPLPAAEACPGLSGSLSISGFPAGVLFPLFDGADLHSALLVDCVDGTAPWSGPHGSRRHRTVALVEAIARSTSAAIGYHSLRQIQREDAYISVALLQVARAVAGLERLNEVLAVVARLPSALIGAEGCLVIRWREDVGAFDCAQAYGLPVGAKAAAAAAALSPEAAPLLWELRLTHGPEDSGVPFAGSRLRQDSADDLGALGVLLGLEDDRDRVVRALPLVAKGRFVGALVVSDSVSPPRTGDRRAEILQGIADQAAIAIHNDQLQAQVSRRERLEQEMKLAHEIQAGLMPDDLPPIPGWEMASACVPAREVGGDFFDVFELPGAGLGFVIADVADKGMPAALFMANARAMIRALATYQDSPLGVMTEVNRLLVPDSYRGMFVTAFYAVLSPATGLLTYCNAGHNPPLLWCSGEARVSRLKTGGTALAVLEEPFLSEYGVTLDPGDWIVLYTDGVTEAYSAQSDASYGEERLVRLVEENAAGSSATMVRAIDRAVRGFVGDTPQYDDQTLLVLKRDEAAPV